MQTTTTKVMTDVEAVRTANVADMKTLEVSKAKHVAVKRRWLHDFLAEIEKMKERPPFRLVSVNQAGKDNDEEVFVLREDLDAAMVQLPTHVGARFGQMMAVTANCAATIGCTLDTQFTEGQVANALQRRHEEEEQRHNQLAAESSAQDSNKGAGRDFLLGNFNRMVQAAILIQRAFRAFKTKCKDGGDWPSASPERAYRARARYMEGLQAATAKGKADHAAMAQARQVAMKEAEQVAQNFEALAKQRAAEGVLRAPKGGASTAYHMDDPTYRKLLLGSSWVEREQRERDEAEQAAQQQGEEEQGPRLLEECVSPMAKARLAMQGMRLPAAQPGSPKAPAAGSPKAATARSPKAAAARSPKSAAAGRGGPSSGQDLFKGLVFGGDMSLVEAITSAGSKEGMQAAIREQVRQMTQAQIQAEQARARAGFGSTTARPNLAQADSYGDNSGSSAPQDSSHVERGKQAGGYGFGSSMDRPVAVHEEGHNGVAGLQTGDIHDTQNTAGKARQPQKGRSRLSLELPSEGGEPTDSSFSPQPGRPTGAYYSLPPHTLPANMRVGSECGSEASGDAGSGRPGTSGGLFPTLCRSPLAKAGSLQVLMDSVVERAIKRTLTIMDKVADLGNGLQLDVARSPSRGRGSFHRKMSFITREELRGSSRFPKRLSDPGSSRGDLPDAWARQVPRRAGLSPPRQDPAASPTPAVDAGCCNPADGSDVTKTHEKQVCGARKSLTFWSTPEMPGGVGGRAAGATAGPAFRASSRGISTRLHRGRALTVAEPVAVKLARGSQSGPLSPSPPTARREGIKSGRLSLSALTVRMTSGRHSVEAPLRTRCSAPQIDNGSQQRDQQRELDEQQQQQRMQSVGGSPSGRFGLMSHQSRNMTSNALSAEAETATQPSLLNHVPAAAEGPAAAAAAAGEAAEAGIAQRRPDPLEEIHVQGATSASPEHPSGYDTWEGDPLQCLPLQWQHNLEAYNRVSASGVASSRGSLLLPDVHMGSSRWQQQQEGRPNIYRSLPVKDSRCKSSPGHVLGNASRPSQACGGRQSGVSQAWSKASGSAQTPQRPLPKHGGKVVHTLKRSKAGTWMSVVSAPNERVTLGGMEDLRSLNPGELCLMSRPLAQRGQV